MVNVRPSGTACTCRVLQPSPCLRNKTGGGLGCRTEPLCSSVGGADTLRILANKSKTKTDRQGWEMREELWCERAAGEEESAGGECSRECNMV